MPRQDKTGPMGQGALTGRGFGLCGQGLTRRGRFCRMGMGRGFGFGRTFDVPIELSKSDQKKILEAELKEIESEEKEIKAELTKLK